MAARQSVSAVEPTTEDDDLNMEASEGKLVPYRSHQPMQQWTPSFALTVDEAVHQVEEKRQFMDRVMRKGEHYGAIPGTKKPTLLKAGAELLLSAMALHPTYGAAGPSEVDLAGHDHNGEAYVRHQRVCRIWRQTGPGEHDRMLVAEGEGSCNSWEAKYRWRESKRRCPSCSREAIIKGKAEYGGGWVCFKKQAGCGATFKDGDKTVEGQKLGREPNPDIADLDNTILKMANKRALVAATLNATGCSDLFTQDVEDMSPGARGQASAADDLPPAYGGDYDHESDSEGDPRDERQESPPQAQPPPPAPSPTNRNPEKPPCPKCKTNEFAGQYKTPKDPAKPYFCKKDKGGCGDDYGSDESSGNGSTAKLTLEERESLAAKNSKLPIEFQWPPAERGALVAEGFKEALAKIERRQELAAIYAELPTNYKPDAETLAGLLRDSHEDAKSILTLWLNDSKQTAESEGEPIDSTVAAEVDPDKAIEDIDAGKTDQGSLLNRDGS